MLKFVVLIFTLILSVSLGAQQAPEDAKKITCKTSISFRDLCKSIVSAGVPVSSSDIDGGYIITEYIDAMRGQYKMLMTLSDGQVDVIGLSRVEDVGVTPVINKGQKRSINRLSFAAMDAFIKDNMSCAEVLYLH